MYIQTYTHVYILGLVLIEIYCLRKAKLFCAKDSPSEPRDEWMLIIFVPSGRARVTEVPRGIPKEDAD